MIYFVTSLLTLVTLLVSTVPSSAAGIGKEICAPYKPLVVQITTLFARGAKEYGFGFIVGEQDNKFYIVTANHVVRSSYPDKATEKVLLRFSWDPGGSGKKAELLDTMYKPLDLALLRIDKSMIMGTNRINWTGRTWCHKWQVEEKVWFVGRSQEWYVPPDQRAGILLRTEADLLGFIHIDIDSIQPGTSGAPLVIKNGLVGMVVNDSHEKAQAVNIDHIRRFVSVENPYPWNLVKYESNTDTTRAKSMKPMATNTSIKNNGLPARQERGDTFYQGGAPAKPEVKTAAVEHPAPLLPQSGDLLFEPLTKIEFIRLPADCFAMGSPKKEKGRYSNEAPQHPVCVDAFWMGKHEVTLAQWIKIMGKKSRRAQGSGSHPAALVTWEEARDFISRLNKKTGQVFRLPTEAEWEYAARAGTTTARYWGDDISCDKAMYGNDANESSCVDYVQQQGGVTGLSAPAGSYPSNKFGLHDMLGNVREWCADWYGEEYYFSSPKDNPTGPSQSSVDPPARVLRGGSWLDGSRIIRAAARQWLAPEKRYYDTGFRLVLVDQESGPDGP